MLWKEICAARKNNIPLSVFCFINFGIDYGFWKQISFCTLCLKSLKPVIIKELIRFSHSLIQMHRFLIEKVHLVYLHKDK